MAVKCASRLCVLGCVGVFVVRSIAVAQVSQTPFPLPTPTKTPATLTFDQLRQGITQTYKQLWALDVEYVQLTEGGVGIPYMKLHFAMKGESRLNDKMMKDGQEYAVAYDGDNLEVYQPKLKLAHIEKEKGNVADVDAYAEELGLQVSDADRATALQSDKLLFPYVLDVPDLGWKVQPTLETVDGVECHVLVSLRRQRIWIDAAKGFALRFREEYQPIPRITEAQWPLAGRHLYTDFTEVQTGLWLPRKIQAIGYASAASPRSQWNRPSALTVFTVQKLAVGHQVADSCFRFNFVPGTEVHDAVRDRSYRIGESGEELERLVGEGRKELAKSRTGRHVWLLLANVAVIIAAMVFYLGYRIVRRHRAGNRPTSNDGGT